MLLPKLPKGWSAQGHIPNVDPGKADPQTLDQLDEDLLQIRDGTEQYTLDVGWYPAASPHGRFIGRLVVADDWDHPLERIETPNRDVLRSWLGNAVSGIQTRQGKRGEFSTRVGIFVYKGKKKGKPAVRSLVAPKFASNSQNRWSKSQSRPDQSAPSTSAALPYQPAYAP